MRRWQSIESCQSATHRTTTRLRPLARGGRSPLQTAVLALALVLAMLPASRVWAETREMKPLPKDQECGPLPVVKSVAFKPGEESHYDLDVLTANAARMEVVSLPKANGALPIRVRVKTNTFFNKVRKVKAEAESYLSPKSLHPIRYTEDSWEDEEHKVADVDFRPKNVLPSTVLIKYQSNPKAGQSLMTVAGRYSHDALDVLGAIFLVRSLDLKPGLALCFDVYAMRHMWRVWGTVTGTEMAPTKAGEFNAFVMSGTAARLDAPAVQRDLELWISADEERIPLGALGAIDLGPVRATLVHRGRTDDQQPKTTRVNDLDW